MFLVFVKFVSLSWIELCFLNCMVGDSLVFNFSRAEDLTVESIFKNLFWIPFFSLCCELCLTAFFFGIVAAMACCVKCFFCDEVFPFIAVFSIHLPNESCHSLLFVCIGKY